MNPLFSHSHNRLGCRFIQNMGSSQFPEFVKVKSGTSASEFQTRINEIDILKEKYISIIKTTKTTIIARPLTNLRFAKDVAENPLFNTNNKSSVNTLFAVGIFILIIALLNYVNFATATLPKRMKNIGVTRILGNDRRRIFVTTILESVLVSALSFLVALIIANSINNQFGIKFFEYSLDFKAAIYVISGCWALRLL